uniref:Uncharacterized protein n=1 Tax=Marseillevirus LCMAC201 TaxID=2506605 RepID=A0A481YWS7_9VIRU|nr:MAG: hypothetical protein LCMAC201_04820 [Marseillevirus LCMAC201]
MSLQGINDNIVVLGRKIDKLEQQVTHDRVVINTHPLIFVVLLVGFFITMDFWAVAAHSTIHRFHPRGHLRYWEYIILAGISLVVLIWVGYKNGIRLSMLGNG